MRTRSSESTERFNPHPTLFPIEQARTRKQKTYRPTSRRIWSHSKADFIARYLKLFVQITKHGAYIDGFAGPQYTEHLDAWTAAKVLANEPKWLRQFFLCEIKTSSVAHLRKLKASQPPIFDKTGRLMTRQVVIVVGDFNETVDQVLKDPRLSQKEATFCLLDQRTFECRWSTLKKLAAFKRPPQNKIEILYFLGVGWIHRAMSGLAEIQDLEPWWGRDDWNSLPDMTCFDLTETVRKRFVSELGYKHTAAYPIFESDGSNRVMYYMIHASDHEEAPSLMMRAHAHAVRSQPKALQRDLWTE